MEYRESEGDGRALRAGAGVIAVLLSAGAAAADRLAPLTAGEVGYDRAHCAAWAPGARLVLCFEIGQDVDTTVTARVLSLGTHPPVHVPLLASTAPGSMEEDTRIVLRRDGLRRLNALVRAWRFEPIEPVWEGGPPVTLPSGAVVSGGVDGVHVERDGTRIATARPFVYKATDVSAYAAADVLVVVFDWAHEIGSTAASFDILPTTRPPGCTAGCPPNPEAFAPFARAACIGALDREHLDALEEGLVEGRLAAGDIEVLAALAGIPAGPGASGRGRRRSRPEPAAWVLPGCAAPPAWRRTRNGGKNADARRGLMAVADLARRGHYDPLPPGERIRWPSACAPGAPCVAVFETLGLELPVSASWRLEREKGGSYTLMTGPGVDPIELDVRERPGRAGAQTPEERVTRRSVSRRAGLEIHVLEGVDRDEESSERFTTVRAVTPRGRELVASRRWGAHDPEPTPTLRGIFGALLLRGE